MQTSLTDLFLMRRFSVSLQLWHERPRSGRSSAGAPACHQESAGESDTRSPLTRNTVDILFLWPRLVAAVLCLVLTRVPTLDQMPRQTTAMISGMALGAVAGAALGRY